MFKLNQETKDVLFNLVPHFGYNGFGELVYYRTYSRVMPDGTQEQWSDTVIRVIEGMFSIRKNYYTAHSLPWNEKETQEYAHCAAVSLFRMEWLPPGRGLWAMGTDLIKKRGAMPLYNCAFTTIGSKQDPSSWIKDLGWMMDLLMHGVGVGFEPVRDDNLRLHREPLREPIDYVINDTREGWVDSVEYLLGRYLYGDAEPIFNYNFIRSAGQPLKTFGGTASGPGPLIELHQRIRETCDRYIYNEIDSVIFKTDLANQIGCCVVAGNIRRSAQIALAPVSDPVFKDLKNYEMFPHRLPWGWMSNNAGKLVETKDFEQLGNIAYRAINNSDLGIMNMKNTKYGRIGDPKYKEDVGTGLNPCGEVILENKEVCNLACTCPTRCATEEDWLYACDYATYYCSTIALLPTHQPETNAVIARNRRIGVSITGFTDWKEERSTHEIIASLRKGYAAVKTRNLCLANEAGVRPSIRLTTMKPDGTVSKLMGRAPGAHYPNYTYMIRRIRIQTGTPINQLLIDANIPHEPCVMQPEYTTVFSYPIHTATRPMSDVSLWMQANNLVLLQREWADNAVSNTLYFSKEEEDQIEDVLSSIVPVTKSISMMPIDCNAYEQMPEEEITKEEYEARINHIKTIDWSMFRGDGIDQKYCTAEGCVT